MGNSPFPFSFIVHKKNRIKIGDTETHPKNALSVHWEKILLHQDHLPCDESAAGLQTVEV